MLNLIKKSILKYNLNYLYRKALETKRTHGMKVSNDFKSKYNCTYLNDTHLYFQNQCGKELEEVSKYSINVNAYGDIFLKEVHKNDYEIFMLDNKPFKRYRVSVYAVSMSL